MLRLRQILLVSVLLMLLGIGPAFAQESCPNNLPPRLLIGQQARVVPGDPNNVRQQPTTSASRIGLIPGNSVFTVLDGPVCADGFTWWQVDYRGLVGWTAEGETTRYWLEPIPDTSPTSVPTQTGLPTPAPLPTVQSPSTDASPFTLSPTPESTIATPIISDASITVNNLDKLLIVGSVENPSNNAFASNGTFFSGGYFYTSPDASQPLSEAEPADPTLWNYDRYGGYAPIFSPNHQYAYQPINDPLNGSIVLVYRLDGGEFKAERAIPVNGDPSLFDLSPDGTLLVIGDRSTQAPIHVYDVLTGERLYQIDAPQLIQDARFTPDGSYLVVGSLRTSLYDPKTGTLVREINGFNRRFTSTADIEFSPDGARLYSITTGDVLVFDTNTWQEIAHYDLFEAERDLEGVDCIAYGDAKISPDGTMLVYLNAPSGEQVAVCFLSSSGGKIITFYTLPELSGPHAQLVFSPDMRLLLVGGYTLSLSGTPSGE